MNVLVTGAGGFIGRNLVESLKNLRDGKDRTRAIAVDAIYEFGRRSTAEELADCCQKADIVFHLAGVNRPERTEEFMQGNAELTARLLAALRQAGNRCPVVLASSVQATLLGRYAGSEYGRSKRAGEDLVFEHSRVCGAEVLVYRFPNVFGKWCRPDYNSVVATFCHHIAREEAIRVNDPAAMLELVYIDDVVAELLDALEGRPHRCQYNGLHPAAARDGRFCYVPVTHEISLGELEKLLRRFHEGPLQMPAIPAGSFAKKLYSTYLSYLPPDKAAWPLEGHADERGSFTELIKTESGGQVSVNVSRPGITKGEHWHHSKWEIFIVVSGRARIRMRPIGGGEITEFVVSGEQPEAVHMLPGYTHSIVNLSDTQELVTVMWANESFDPAHPDTFYEKV